jgi:hypothetical protein
MLFLTGTSVIVKIGKLDMREARCVQRTHLRAMVLTTGLKFHTGISGIIKEVYT